MTIRRVSEAKKALFKGAVQNLASNTLFFAQNLSVSIPTTKALLIFWVLIVVFKIRWPETKNSQASIFPVFIFSSFFRPSVFEVFSLVANLPIKSTRTL